MAERFTGFWEATGPDLDEVATTVSYWPTEELIERLRKRLQETPPGTHIRIDLIAWGPDD